MGHPRRIDNLSVFLQTPIIPQLGLLFREKSRNNVI